ncbi:MAG: DUF4345 domain-containing protein [Filimonas sp.]|nr:DUF4345 domain-containing protein [Filimonas sp.]
MKAKNIHLLASIIVIVPIAIVYGLLPGGFMQSCFHFTLEQRGLSGIFRALMGLYIAMAAFWFVGIIKPAYWKPATIANILFMAGLASGRIISIVFDGTPSNFFLVGLVVEVLLAAWGIVSLSKYKA